MKHNVNNKAFIYKASIVWLTVDTVCWTLFPEICTQTLYDFFDSENIKLLVRSRPTGAHCPATAIDVAKCPFTP